MNIRQHISTHLERFFSALLPGGFWQVGRCSAALCPAKHPAMRPRVNKRGYRKA